MMQEGKFHCGVCNARLIQLCYQRSDAFRLYRETMLFAMRSLARIHSVDSRLQDAPAAECSDCVRTMKVRLKEKSILFRVLNRCMNPFFHAFRDRLVTGQEMAGARRFASEACRRAVSGDNSASRQRKP